MVIQYNNFLMKKKSSLPPKSFFFFFNWEELQYLTYRKSFMSGLPVYFCGPVYCDSNTVFLPGRATPNM